MGSLISRRYKIMIKQLQGIKIGVRERSIGMKKVGREGERREGGGRERGEKGEGRRECPYKYRITLFSSRNKIC